MALRSDILFLATQGMAVQTTRSKVIAENMSHVGEENLVPNVPPYRRKLVAVKNKIDKKRNIKYTAFDRTVEDQTPFTQKYSPQSPGADAKGMVQVSNVNVFLEARDHQESKNIHTALEQAFRTESQKIKNIIDLLK